MIIVLDKDHRLIIDLEIREEIDMCKKQLKSMKMDLEQEYSRAEELKRELSETKKQLDKTERELMYNFAEKRRQSLENYEQQYYKKIYGKAATEPLHSEDVVDTLECEKPAHDDLLDS